MDTGLGNGRINKLLSMSFPLMGGEVNSNTEMHSCYSYHMITLPAKEGKDQTCCGHCWHVSTLRSNIVTLKHAIFM